uniref:Rod shape-determining protein MreD n=1 Tax=uncultured bacterium CSL1 TaxID=1091565 RepID=G4WVB8_9BACT|nr:hypothetical protein [uncultured bacterium CSL1]
MQRLFSLTRDRRFLFLAGLVFAAALSRLLPHPYNFSPVGAIALFSGARFNNLRTAILVPLAAMLVSDLFIGFYSGVWLVYAAFTLIVLLGHFVLRHRSGALIIASCAVATSVLFFLLTNCVWLYNENLYPVSIAGQIAAYTDAVPFFWNTLAGDLFYVSLLFGALAYAQRKYPLLALRAAVQ